jgi:hypothetical protein
MLNKCKYASSFKITSLQFVMVKFKLNHMSSGSLIQQI